MDSGLCWGASEWEQTPDSCDNNARHRSTPVLPITFLTFGGNLRPERTTHTFLLLPPSPLLPDGFFKTEKFPPAEMAQILPIRFQEHLQVSSHRGVKKDFQNPSRLFAFHGRLARVGRHKQHMSHLNGI